MLPEEDPGIVDVPVIANPRHSDNGDKSHDDIQAKECTHAYLLATRDFDIPKDPYWDTYNCRAVSFKIIRLGWKLTHKISHDI